MFPKEKQFADLLDKQKKEWQYPTKRFDLGNTTYRPDFYLPNENLYIEVIGTRQAYHANKNKIFKFRKLYPFVKFIIVDFTNQIYPNIKYPYKWFPKIEPYYNSFIVKNIKHWRNNCGFKSWNPKECLTCYTINLYRKRKYFNSPKELLEYLIDKKRV